MKFRKKVEMFGSYIHMVIEVIANGKHEKFNCVFF